MTHNKGATGKVSVIVPTYNAGPMICVCLESILMNDYDDFEVIVVDDGSTDDSCELIRSLLTRHENLYLLEELHAGPACARNAGIRRARGEYLFFTDSDVIVPTDWITRMRLEFDMHDVEAVGGGVVPYAITTVFEEAEHIRYLRIVGDTARYVEAQPTCNLAVKRSVFKEVGLFDEEFRLPSGEDYDFCYRLGRYGYRIWFAPECAVRHRHPQKLAGIIRRAFWYGFEQVRVREKRGLRVCGTSEYGVLAFLAAARRSVCLRTNKDIPLRCRWVVIVYEIFYQFGGLAGLLAYAMRRLTGRTSCARTQLLSRENE